MNSIDLSPLYRSSVGFDRLAAVLHNALRTDSTTNAYPNYNIESRDENCYTITLAVAGFSRDQLDIEVVKGVLTVRGKQSENSDKKTEYLYRGIPDVNFERRFNLADYVEVTSADLENGLLTIHLVKNIPEEMKPRQISINGRSEAALEHKPDTKKVA